MSQVALQASCHDFFAVFSKRGKIFSFAVLLSFFVNYTFQSFSNSIFAANTTMSAEVDNILRSFWEWRLKESPEFATQIGVHTYDNSLDGHSLGAYAKRQVQYSLVVNIT